MIQFVGIELIVTVLASVTGLMLGSKSIGSLFKRESYNTENAADLLKLSRPDEWNEIRILNPEWTPKLDGMDLRNLSLQNLNLRDSSLRACDFSDSNLDGANFERSALSNAKFDNCSLVDADFSEADLSGTSFINAVTNKADFTGAKGSSFPDSKVVKDSSIEKDYKELRNDLVHGNLKLDALTHVELEGLVANLFSDLGYSVEGNSSQRDEGFDLILKKSDPIFGDDVTIVEIKRYSHDRKISVSSIRALIGAMLEKQAQHAVLITNSAFTQGVSKIASEHKAIRLIDGEELVRMLIAAGNS